MCLKQFCLQLTHCGLVMPYGDTAGLTLVQVMGLLPDGTEPLPKQMLTSHPQGHQMCVKYMYAPESCTLFQYKELNIVFADMDIPIIKIRRSPDCLVMVRQLFYIEMAPWSCPIEDMYYATVLDLGIETQFSSSYWSTLCKHSVAYLYGWNMGVFCEFKLGIFSEFVRDLYNFMHIILDINGLVIFFLSNFCLLKSRNGVLNVSIGYNFSCWLHPTWPASD